MEKCEHSVPVREKIAYGLGGTSTNLAWRTLMVFLPRMSPAFPLLQWGRCCSLKRYPFILVLVSRRYTMGVT